jgi:hypothetical protein
MRWRRRIDVRWSPQPSDGSERGPIVTSKHHAADPHVGSRLTRYGIAMHILQGDMESQCVLGAYHVVRFCYWAGTGLYQRDQFARLDAYALPRARCRRLSRARNSRRRFTMHGKVGPLTY